MAEGTRNYIRNLQQDHDDVEVEPTLAVGAAAGGTAPPTMGNNELAHVLRQLTERLGALEGSLAGLREEQAEQRTAIDNLPTGGTRAPGNNANTTNGILVNADTVANANEGQNEGGGASPGGGDERAAEDDDRAGVGAGVQQNQLNVTRVDGPTGDDVADDRSEDSFDSLHSLLEDFPAIYAAYDARTPYPRPDTERELPPHQWHLGDTPGGAAMTYAHLKAANRDGMRHEFSALYAALSYNHDGITALAKALLSIAHRIRRDTLEGFVRSMNTLMATNELVEQRLEILKAFANASAPSSTQFEKQWLTFLTTRQRHATENTAIRNESLKEEFKKFEQHYLTAALKTATKQAAGPAKK